MRALLFPIVALAGCLIVTSSTSAAVVAAYSFDTLPGQASNAFTLAATSFDPTLTASSITPNPTTGATPSTDTLTIGTRGATAPSANTDLWANFVGSGGTSEATALSRNDFFSFVITPTNAVTLSTLTFAYTPGGTSTGGRTTFVRTSIDNFAADVGSSNSNTTGTAQSASYDLAAAYGTAAQNITAPITVRFYHYNGTSNTGGSFVYDDITVNGTVAVPEPAALCFLALAALPLLHRRGR